MLTKYNDMILKFKKCQKWKKAIKKYAFHKKN